MQMATSENKGEGPQEMKDEDVMDADEFLNGPDGEGGEVSKSASGAKSSNVAAEKSKQDGADDGGGSGGGDDEPDLLVSRTKLYKSTLKDSGDGDDEIIKRRNGSKSFKRKNAGKSSSSNAGKSSSSNAGKSSSSSRHFGGKRGSKRARLMNNMSGSNEK